MDEQYNPGLIEKTAKFVWTLGEQTIICAALPSLAMPTVWRTWKKPRNEQADNLETYLKVAKGVGFILGCGAAVAQLPVYFYYLSKGKAWPAYVLGSLALSNMFSALGIYDGAFGLNRPSSSEERTPGQSLEQIAESQNPDSKGLETQMDARNPSEVSVE